MMLLEKLAEGFLLDCKARKLSQGTLRIYTTVLRELADFLKNPQATEITSDDLRRFIVFNQERDKYSIGNSRFNVAQKGAKLSKWAIHRYVRSIKTFFAWAWREGLVEKDPATKLRKPKLPQEQRAAFSESEVQKILAIAKKMSFRDYAICFLLLDSGLRKSELTALTTDDVNLITGVIRVRHGKGDKSRQVCVGKMCRKTLWLYANEYRHGKDGESAFFISSQGGPLGYNALAMIMRRLTAKCGFRVFAHRFRHTFATNLARKTQNAFLLAQVLGHSDLSTSRGYIHLAAGDSAALGSPMDDMLGSRK